MTTEAQPVTPSVGDERVAVAPERVTGRRWARPWSWSGNGGLPADEAELIEEADEATAGAVAGSWVPVVLIAIMVTGLVMRLSAAEHLSPQIDEPASVMAAHMVVERGLPIFPSDIPYFQGATLSYVLAPFVALGFGDLTDLYTMRLVSVLASMLALYFTYRLGRKLSGEALPGVIAAGLLALDPISVQWSGHVRMYAPLQALSVLLAWLFCRVVLDGPTRRLLIGIVVVFWLGVFTQIAIALFWPAMALVALARYRHALRNKRRDVAVTLGLCFLAPITLFGINSALGPSDRADSESAPFLSFVGDHLLSVTRLLRPTFQAWELLFNGSALVNVMPYVIVGISCLLAGRYLLGRIDAGESRDRLAVATILAFYWVPILLVGTFTNEPQERYVIHVQPLGFLVAALAVRELLARRPSLELAPRWQARTFRSLGAVVLALLLVHLGSGLNYLTNHTTIDPNYVEAAEYVAARREPGERVIVALPPPAYLALGGNDEMIFAPGPYESKRTDRYTRQVGEGEFIDYWAGVPAVVTTNQLCQTLLTYPDTWLLVDSQRLGASWAYAGDMATVIRGLTYQRYAAQGNALVLRVAPLPSRDARAEKICRQAAEAIPPWELEEQAAQTQAQR